MKKYFAIYRRSDGKEGSRTLAARSRDEVAGRLKAKLGRKYAGLILVKELKSG